MVTPKLRDACSNNEYLSGLDDLMKICMAVKCLADRKVVPTLTTIRESLDGVLGQKQVFSAFEVARIGGAVEMCPFKGDESIATGYDLNEHISQHVSSEMEKAGYQHS